MNHISKFTTKIDLADDEAIRDDSIILSGPLDFSSAEAVYQRGKTFIQTNNQCIFDLAGVSKSDSAALATLIAWRNYSVKHNKDIQFINLPKQMLSIAHLCGLQDIL